MTARGTLARGAATDSTERCGSVRASGASGRWLALPMSADAPVDRQPESYAHASTARPRTFAVALQVAHNPRTVARYTVTTHVGAPRDQVFALWTNLERMGEWVGGVTGVSDVSGSIDEVGTTYIVHFGPVKSPTEILETDRPRLFTTRFGSWILRGRSSATFEPEADGTRITQTFETVGVISAISSWIFSRGSYEGSFRGELEKFARLAEREAPRPPGT